MRKIFTYKDIDGKLCGIDSALIYEIISSSELLDDDDDNTGAFSSNKKEKYGSTIGVRDTSEDGDGDSMDDRTSMEESAVLVKRWAELERVMMPANELQ